MVDLVTGQPHTAHTTNPVPLLYISEEAKNFRLRPDGSLRDISPTLLNILQHAHGFNNFCISQVFID